VLKEDMSSSPIALHRRASCWGEAELGRVATPAYPHSLTEGPLSSSCDCRGVLPIGTARAFPTRCCDCQLPYQPSLLRCG